MIALILGCGECVWDDAKRALSLCTPDAIFAVKDMMVRWPLRIDYGITLHPDRTDQYLRDRKLRGYKLGFEIWAHRQFGSQFQHKTMNDWSGSSGLFAVKVAREQGFVSLLAGVPMDAQYGHITRKEAWGAANLFRNGWNHRQKELAPIVRSVSGWTMETFGKPDQKWIEQNGGSSEPDHKMLEALEASLK